MTKKTLIAAMLIAAAACLTGCAANDERPSYSYSYSSEYTAPVASFDSSSSVSSVSEPVESSSAESVSEPESAVSSSKSATSSSKPSSSSSDSSVPSLPSVPNKSSKPASSGTPSQSSKPASSSSSGTGAPGLPSVPNKSSKPTSSGSSAQPAASDIGFDSIEAIAKLRGLKSKPETDLKACIVEVDKGSANPYDVDYDYGALYESYIKACDWSLVFDISYYKSQFPMLAWLYENDYSLLLRHFQTVGIHEGRQGSSKFNVGAYMRNCDQSLKSAFGDDYECYYIYYMLHHASEKAVNAASGSGLKTQYKLVLTKLQSNELGGINMYRRQVNVSNVAIDSELIALANKRAYINAHDGYRHHDYVNSSDHVIKIYSLLDPSISGFSENTVSIPDCTPACRLSCAISDDFYTLYRNSKSHYEAMIDPLNLKTGCSNVYSSAKDIFSSQFDVFAQY